MDILKFAKHFESLASEYEEGNKEWLKKQKLIDLVEIFDYLTDNGDRSPWDDRELDEIRNEISRRDKVWAQKEHESAGGTWSEDDMIEVLE